MYACVCVCVCVCLWSCTALPPPPPYSNPHPHPVAPLRCQSVYCDIMWRCSASLADYAIYSRPSSIVLPLYRVLMQVNLLHCVQSCGAKFQRCYLARSAITSCEPIRQNEPITLQIAIHRRSSGSKAKQKMAGKLLKHLGFGAKKAPPQPPKPDYTAIKLTSSESALSKSPTSDRSGTSHIGEFELAQLPGSPHRITPSDKGNFGGARPKDSGGGISPKSAPGDRASVSIDEPETPGPEKESQQGKSGGQGASATPVSECKHNAVKVTWFVYCQNHSRPSDK